MTGNLLDLVKDEIRTMGAKFTDPDDDWPSALFVRTRPRGEPLAIVLAVGRRVPPEEIAAIIREQRTPEAVLISAGWAPGELFEKAHSPDPTCVSNIDIWSDPDKREVLALTYVTRWSATMGVAIIGRRADGVRILGEFIWDEGPNIGGMFPDAMRLAIQ